MLNTDWLVIGIDSFGHMGLSDRITTMWDAHPEWRERTKIVTHDLVAPISEQTAVRIGPIHYLINLASMSDVFGSIEDPVPFVQNNVSVILNVLEYARRVDPQAFLQVSTDEVYGPTDGTFLHKEWDPIVPSSPYSASKAAQEAIAISYWRTYNVPLILVNLMNNFGEMQSAKKFPALVQRKVAAHEVVTIHGQRETQGSRCYIHSRNTADALLFLLKQGAPYEHLPGHMDKPDRYNIPGDAQVTNLDLAKLIADELGVALLAKFEDFADARPGHDRHYGLDGAKLRALGWQSPLSFDEAMRMVVRWQKEHPEWLDPRKTRSR